MTGVDRFASTVLVIPVDRNAADGNWVLGNRNLLSLNDWDLRLI